MRRYSEKENLINKDTVSYIKTSQFCFIKHTNKYGNIKIRKSKQVVITYAYLIVYICIDSTFTVTQTWSCSFSTNIFWNSPHKAIKQFQTSSSEPSINTTTLATLGGKPKHKLVANFNWIHSERTVSLKNYLKATQSSKGWDGNSEV